MNPASAWVVTQHVDGRGLVTHARTGELVASFENPEAAWAAVREAERLAPMPQPKRVRQ